MIRRPPRSRRTDTLFPYTTLFRSQVPMLRGRIAAVNGVSPSELEIPGDVQWVFRGDRGLTWMREPRAVDKITAGEWWPPDYDGAPLVSLHEDRKSTRLNSSH